MRGLQLIRICLLPYARCLVLVATLTGRLLSLHILYFSDSSLVAKAGLEPARLAAPDFESGTSTNSITRPYMRLFYRLPQNLYKTHSKGVHSLISSITGQLAFPAGSLSSYHPCIVSTPRRAGSRIRSRLAQQFSGATVKPHGLHFRFLVIVQNPGGKE